MSCTALSVIGEREAGNRPILTCRADLVLLIQGTDDAPDLACGQCGNMLTSGVSVRRFITVNEAVDMEVRAFPMDDGPFVICGTLKLSPDAYMAGTSKPVLKCPACDALNDTGSPGHT